VSRRLRLALFAVAAVALGALLVSAVLDLPPVGHAGGAYAQLAVDTSLSARHVNNTVSGVNFDLRGFDTLAEEMILFVAAIGCAVLLRARRGEQELEEAADRARENAPDPGRSLPALASLLAGPIVVLGLYVVTHGPLSPGGGFQGGVILAAAVVVSGAAGHVLHARRVDPVHAVEAMEAVGALAYSLVAIGGALFAAVVMENFLDPGRTGALLSGGTIPILSAAVGVEVAGAVVLILVEFLDQALLRREGHHG
jgi:multicomponent Na+:H+ antiporter subunit B